MMKGRSVVKGKKTKLYTLIQLIIAFSILFLFYKIESISPNESTKLNISALEGTWEANEDGSEGLFESTLHKGPTDNLTISFLQSHMEVKVWINGVERYHLAVNPKAFSRTTGERYVFIPLEKEDAEQPVKIMLKSVYGNRIQQPTICIGDKNDIQYGVIAHDRYTLLSCFLLGLSGVIIILYGIFSGAGRKLGNTVMYLGVFSIILGLWRFSHTNIFHLFFTQSAQGSMIEHIAFMILTVPLCQFIKMFYNKKYQRLVNGYCLFSCLIIGIRLLLQCLQKIDLGETLRLTHIDIVILLGLNFSALCDAIWNKRNRKEYLYHYISFFVILGITGGCLVSYYTLNYNSNSIAWVFLLYIVLIGILTMKRSQRLLDQDKEIELYKKLSYKDALTNTYNRVAFLKDIKDRTIIDTEHGIVTAKPTMIAMFDLNYLKRLNDQYGHQWGDEYIVSVATIIEKLCMNRGRCYRMGGDEFCAIIDDDHIDIEEYRAAFKEELKEAEKKLLVENLQVAIGFACFDKSLDKDLNDTKNRADSAMYQNKREIKAKG